MGDILEDMRRHVLAWTTGTALTLVLLRMVTPSFVDFIFDILTVALVWVAGKVSKV